MPLRKLSFECTECGKTVVGNGIFLQDNGNREGFCDLFCVLRYVENQTFPGGRRLKDKPKKVKKEPPPQPPPGKPG
jgi:hypothetical protein